MLRQNNANCTRVGFECTGVSVMRYTRTTYILEQTQHLIVCSVVRDEEA